MLRRLVRGVDVYGRICGVSEGVEDFPLAAWPHPLYYKVKTCVQDCSHTNLVWTFISGLISWLLFDFWRCSSVFFRILPKIWRGGIAAFHVRILSNAFMFVKCVVLESYLLCCALLSLVLLCPRFLEQRDFRLNPGEPVVCFPTHSLCNAVFSAARGILWRSVWKCQWNSLQINWRFATNLAADSLQFLRGVNCDVRVRVLASLFCWNAHCSMLSAIGRDIDALHLVRLLNMCWVFRRLVA